MKLKIIETGELKVINRICPVHGHDLAEDIICKEFEKLKFDGETDSYECTQEQYDKFRAYIVGSE